MLKAFKTELDPNDKQQTLLVKSVGCARFVFNWGLSLKKIAFDKHEKMPSSIDLHKMLVAIKPTNFPWMYEVSKCAPQEALRDLDQAFAHFFARCKKKKAGKWNGKVGFPNFKAKGKCQNSFREDLHTKVFSNCIQLPRIGKVRLKEHGYIPTDQKVVNATVSLRAGRWFVSVLIDLPDIKPIGKEAIVGVDFGLKALATCSDGIIFENPKPLKKSLKKLRRLSKQVSRKQKGSNNRRKAVDKLAKMHFKITNTRNDALHKMTTQLTKTKSIVVIEDLNVAGMMANRKMARAISDVAWGEARRQLEYKGQWYNCEIVVVDRWFPSSQLCSRCGARKTDLTLGDRIFVCKECGLVIDRDLNAAINLEHWVGNKKIYTARSAGINACGDVGSDCSAMNGETGVNETRNEHSIIKDGYKFHRTEI